MSVAKSNEQSAYWFLRSSLLNKTISKTTLLPSHYSDWVLSFVRLVEKPTNSTQLKKNYKYTEVGSKH